MSKYIDLTLALNKLWRLCEEDIDAEKPEAFDFSRAREALSDLPTIEVSEDCISRAGALKAYNEAVDELVKAEMKEFNLGDFTECSFNTTQLKLIARKIENAPSVVQSRAEGEWVVEEIDSIYGKKIRLTCSECGDVFDVTESAYPYEMYCRYCGAKMKGAEQSLETKLKALQEAVETFT